MFLFWVLMHLGANEKRDSAAQSLPDLLSIFPCGTPVAERWDEGVEEGERSQASFHCTQHTPLTRSFYIHLCSTVAQPRRLTVFRGVYMYKNGGCTCIKRGCTPIRSLENYRSIPLGTKNNK